jgi:sigma-B regulation protein RsbU (phosphoserine phosphatase)
MNIRWKLFSILLVFSLVPLGVLTIISQHGTRRIGDAIAENVAENLTRIADGVLKLTAEKSGEILAKTNKAVAFSLIWLAREAESSLAAGLPPASKIYYSHDFDAAQTAPPDFGPHPDYQRRSADGRLLPQGVSFVHPVFLLAPGVSSTQVGGDAARLSGLTGTFQEIARRLGKTLHWAYISLEDGLHVSYPGHGDYPKGYDPRTRAWYHAATDDVEWTLPMVDATSGQVVMTASKRVRRPDGTAAGVAAMDVLITEVLQIEGLPAIWTSAMRSFLVTSAVNPQTGHPELLIVVQKSHQNAADSWEKPIRTEWLTSENSGSLAQLLQEVELGRSGYVEMPYKGADSIWAYAPIGPKAHFVIIVPKMVIDRMAEKSAGLVKKFTSQELLLRGVAALFAVVIVTLAAFVGSRGITRPIRLLASTARRLSGGDFTARIDLKTGDERDQVIEAFNEMVPKLRDHMRLQESLRLATEVQLNLLPEQDPSVPGFDISGISLSCDETGGDYYDFLEISEDAPGRAGIVIGDVSGHGIQSALLMASARASLRQRVSLPGSLSEIVADVNRQFCQDVRESGAFMTLFYLSVDSTRLSLRWVRAGHDPAILFDPATGAFQELSGKGSPLGFDEALVFEENEKRALQRGQIVFVGTDGIWETMDAQGRMFGKHRVHDIIRCHHGLRARQIVQTVIGKLKEFRQELKPEDDITMVVVKIV